MNWSNNIIKLDLTMCESLEDCKLLREDNDIPEELISDEKLFSYKGVVNTFFYDKQTFNIIAIITNDSDQIQFTDDFVNYLFDIKPLQFKKRKLDLDEILDKINLMGIKSLNKLERGFLKKL